MTKQKFIAFDIDGTYLRTHLFYEVILAMAREGKLHPEINSDALELYDKWKRRAHDKAFEDFDSGTITRIKDLLTELDPKEYDQMREKALKPLLDHVYMWPKQLKEKLQQSGYKIIAISGSRAEEVELFAKHHSFDDWVGQLFQRGEDGKYTGHVKSTYDDKENLLKNMVKKHNLTWSDSYAVGDTSGDIGMLELVENPIAFNPNHSLLEHAKKRGWPIVVERKSIAFKLVLEKGQYVLAETD